MAVTGAVLAGATRRAAHGGGPGSLVARNLVAYRRAWLLFVTGFVEPLLYLFSIGVGIEAIIPGFSFHGREISYTAFVAPALLATAAMNGAILDSTFSVFSKLKFQKVYDGVLATPMSPGDVARGEVAWAVLRGAIYSAVFLVVMLAVGLVSSWWALLALPAAVLIGFAFAGVGMALTTLMRSWQDFEYIQLALMPMFLFSSTFFPVGTYHGVVRWIVEASPLYRGVVLVRELTTGLLTLESAVSVAYLLMMGAVGVTIAARRLDRLLLT